MIYYVCLCSIDFTVWDSSVGRYSNLNSTLKPLTMNKKFNHQKKERVSLPQRISLRQMVCIF